MFVLMFLSYLSSGAGGRDGAKWYKHVRVSRECKTVFDMEAAHQLFIDGEKLGSRCACIYHDTFEAHRRQICVIDVHRVVRKLRLCDEFMRQYTKRLCRGFEVRFAEMRNSVWTIFHVWSAIDVTYLQISARPLNVGIKYVSVGTIHFR